MKVELYAEFIRQLDKQVDFIARDKPSAARGFKKDILKEVFLIGESPFSNRYSIYFDDRVHRDLMYKGYKVIYRVDEAKDTVFVIGLVNMQRGPAKG